MKLTIEKGTTYADLTDEQGVVIDGIHDMIRELQELIDIMQETIDYNDPLLGHKNPAGYIYNIWTDTSKFYRLQERVNNLCNYYGKAVMH